MKEPYPSTLYYYFKDVILFLTLAGLAIAPCRKNTKFLPVRNYIMVVLSYQEITLVSRCLHYDLCDVQIDLLILI